MDDTSNKKSFDHCDTFYATPPTKRVASIACHKSTIMTSKASGIETTLPTNIHQRSNASNGNPTKLVVTEAGREIDKRLDKHETYVFYFLVSFFFLTCYLVMNSVALWVSAPS